MPTRLLIHGANGRMGRAVRRIAVTDERFAIAGVVSRSTPEVRVIDGIPFFAANELSGVPEFDVCIDFSLPEAFDGILAECAKRGAALVSGTTGLSDAQRATLDAASAKIPLIWASNFSLGVALLHQLVEVAATRLPGWDCDIVESHHVHKKDAPSGTALTLGEAAKQGGADPHYASLRAGDIVGEHLVQFSGQGERIELIHRANDRDIFARGALHAAAWLHGRPPGHYRVADTLG
ncbi:4-hydroxy-tetrahydrodipicolinate reductase [Solilutibacter silvestris]|uniref:4-hydroxy-tetrahydrodipicolinate reductase n=1 Tax=Solilutibacter silvestris TaxID=1645665 RepID=A0A2K1PZ71_9GAMM|nr:4-hydroxy-tetrahydrodipicolinate reductase [Lysobacter silvestris]PNS08081.1 dapB: dihydrodipicolinate reductase [Lysobacter silvestris]